MAEPTIQLGGGNWAGKTDNLLGYYKKGERFYKQDFTFSRSTTGTYTDKDGYIQEMPYNLLQQSNDFDTTWGTSSVTISSGKSGYNGTNNAWSLNSSSEGYLFQYLTNETSNTLSIYAKAGSVNNIRLRFFGTSNGEGYFNLSNGTKGTTSGLANSSIENVGNGWYRCNISINTTISLVRIYPSVSSSSSSGTNGFVYIQNAQVNSGTSAKTYFPTTTRLNMPRVDYLNNSNGSLLIEPQRTNLLTYSEDFSNSYWTKSGASVTSGIVSPDGTANAFKLVENTSNSNHQVYRNTVTTTGSFSNTIFVKAAERSKIRLNSGSSSESVSFNLSNGTIISQTGATGKIVSMLNGWYKCTISWNVTSVAAQYLLLGILDDSGNASYTGNGSSGVYIWGAQFEQQSQATAYIKSDGIAAVRKSSTTNLIPYSEDFNNAIWSKVAAGTGITPIVTSDYSLSPIGTQTADRIQFNLNGGTSSSDTSYITTGLSLGTINATVSIYLKTNDSTTKDITLRLGAGLFDYNVTVTSEWQRFSLSGNTNVDRIQLLLYGNQNSQTADLSVWGVQVEQQTQAETYAPTYGLPVTIDLFTENNYGTMTNMSSSDIVEDTPNN